MAKLTLSDVTTSLASNSLLNSNFTLIESAMNNTVSRDGTAPNAMLASFDMGGFNILNLAAPINQTDAATKKYVDDLFTAMASGGVVSVNGKAGVVTLTAADVGAEPALGFTPENVANKAIANGYASLDANGEVAQLPAGAAAAAAGTFLRQDGAWVVSAGVQNAMLGNIADPLVQIPFRRADDETRLSGVQTFTRASTATYVDPLDGLVKTAAVDAPRFERMSDGGVGILLEGASTNHLLYSEVLDLYPWTVARATVSPNAAIAPDGVATADALIEDATASSSHYAVQTTTITGGTTHTFSIYAKAATRSWLYLEVGDNQGSQATAYYDLANGVVGTTGGANLVSTQITGLMNGWVRCEIAVTTTAAAASFYCYLRIALGDGQFMYTGDGTSGIYLWGAQLEALPFASSYIPTTIAAVTREADSLSISAAGNTLPLYDKDWTAIVDFDALGVTGDYRRVFAAKSVGTEQFTAYFNASGVMQYHGHPGAAAGSAISANTVYRCAVRIQNKTINGFLGGSSDGVSPQQASVNAQMTTFTFGRYATPIQYMYGHLRNFRIYDRALTAAEIAAA